jgi:hypothetical protein
VRAKNERAPKSTSRPQHSSFVLATKGLRPSCRRPPFYPSFVLAERATKGLPSKLSSPPILPLVRAR